jgi:hypothetical protein
MGYVIDRNTVAEDAESFPSSQEESILTISFPTTIMMSYGFAPMFGFAILGNLFLLVGTILLLAWAIKNLHKDKLRQVAIGWIIAGALLWLVSSVIGMSIGGFGSHMFRGGNNVPWMMDVK